MAAVPDQALGCTVAISAGTTVAVTTAQTVATGGFVEAAVSWFAFASAPTITMSGGLTWTQDVVVNIASGYGLAILRAQAPAGLAFGTVITATLSGSCSERYMQLWSFTGVDPSAPFNTSASTTGSTIGWTAGTLTPSVPTHVVGCGNGGGSGTGTATPLTGYTEWAGTTGDYNGGGGVQGENVYRLDGNPGVARTPGGTYAVAKAGWVGASAAYKDFAPLVPLVFIPHRMPIGA